MGQRWTEGEIKILKENYGVVTNKLLLTSLPGRSQVSIKTMASKYNLTARANESWAEEEIQILKIYYGKLSRSEFKEKSLLNRTWSAVKHQAMKYGLDGTPQQSRIKFSHNRNYFTKPNPQSAYYGGFIAADGCIGKKWDLLTIGLAKTDRDHLSLFRDNIEYTGRIYDYSSVTNNIICYSSRLHISGAQQIVYALNMHYNITPNKSLSLQPPNIMDEDLIKCFMIGYIDGDGCIDRNAGKPRLAIMGTEAMMLWMKNYIDMWYPEKYAGRDFSIITRGNIHQIRIAGKRAQTILTDLDKYDVPKLARKWDKVKINTEG